MGQSANQSATGGAPRPNTGSRGACRSVNHAVQSAGACLPEPPATKKNALATTTGRPRKEALNALNSPSHFPARFTKILSLLFFSYSIRILPFSIYYMYHV
ncbi:hypothetical protein DM860_008571 [Cuscuta australis]|uniref:Uncharacterized protein n=1 Tax=Cuscuta australis TaxID=267555 RepID=A0A328DAB7_9ASTE|nr:hypothetical protein DM860_008571 [Cuscuta australis]